MTPTEFMNQYRALTVPLDESHHPTIDIHQYLINEHGPHDAGPALAKWDDIRSRIAAANRRGIVRHPTHADHPVHTTTGASTTGLLPGAGGNVPAVQFAPPPPPIDLHLAASHVGGVPYGKGSPDAIAEYLALAVRAGVTTGDALQTFADGRFVGLDCSGFVSNYLVARGIFHEGDQLNHNARSFSDRKPKRMSLDDLTYCDILVWADGHHVAIMEGPACGASGNSQATVVESNGHRGLDSELYQFISVDHNGLFTVHRADNSVHQVHVFNWNLA